MHFSRRSLLTTTYLGTASLLIPNVTLARIELHSGIISTLSDGSISLPSKLTFDAMPRKQLDAIIREFKLSKNFLVRECNVTMFENSYQKVLFDAGAGAGFLDGSGKLIDSLEAINLSPDDITDVIFTHAHPDHIWGILDDFDDLTFPNANYYIGQKEWDFWLNPETVKNVSEDRIATAVGAKRRLEAMKPTINFFENGDEILPGIKAILTPGHTPGHMSFEVGNASNKALIVGDALNNHHVAFRKPSWVTGLDQDPQLAAQTRKDLLEKIMIERMKLVGFHLPNGGIGKVEREADGYNFISM